jgi:hypothetical protein
VLKGRAGGPVPLVARTAERRRRGAAIRARRSVLVTGDAGVGKTRLLEWIGHRAAGEGWQLAQVHALAALATVPFGAMAHLLGPPRVGAAPDEVLFELVARLRALASSEGRLLLSVDDIPSLDDLSAAVVHQVVSLGVVVLVATARHAESLPPGAMELFASHRLDAVALDPLTEEETVELLESLVGGPVSARVAKWMWQATGGNPLFISEIVNDALDRIGPLKLDLIIDQPMATSVAEVIRARLGRLADAERRVLELIAVNGSMSVAALEECGAVPIGRLEALHLVAVSTDERRTKVRLSHSLFADALATTMGWTRRRECARVAADVVAQHGMRRRDDPLAVALGRDAAGDEIAPGIALAAAQAAHARAAPALADRFARMAFQAEPCVMAGILLSYALLYQSKPLEADELMDALEPLVTCAEERALLASTQALNAMHGLIDPARADAVLARHAPLVTGPWRYELAGVQLGVGTFRGRIAEVVAGLDAILANPDVPPRAQMAALVAGLIPLYLSGRTTDAVRLARQLRDDFDRFAGGVPTLQVQAQLELAEALAWHGEGTAACALVDELRVMATSAGSKHLTGIITIVDGMVNALDGTHQPAARAFHALGSLEGSAFVPWIPQFHARLAYADLFDLHETRCHPTLGHRGSPMTDAPISGARSSRRTSSGRSPGQ